MTGNNISLDSSSFSLVRTDARLTGNIKITVDSNDDIWLNSIDGNADLSSDEYKHCAIIDDWSHPMNVSRFFGQIKDSVLEHLFDVRQYVDPEMIAQKLEYEHQYDFSEYFAGAKYLKSKHYDEHFSYFAPLYLKGKDIPAYFVVLKIDGALNDTLVNLISNKSEKYSTPEYMNDILSRSTVIKTFSLGPETRIGKYLRSMVNTENYPTCGLRVNFNKDMFTRWYGLSIKDGVYADAGEMLYDFYNESHPIKIFEQKITDGYKRHGLLHPNILNLEFLFDDDTAEIFEHNRYIGFYINESELGTFKIDANMQKNEQVKFNNYPILYSDIDQLLFNQKIIKNDDGVYLSVADNNIDETDIEKLLLSKDNQCIGYLRDKNEKFHRVKSIVYDKKLKNVQLADKSIDLEDFIGADDEPFINDYAINKNVCGKSFVHIRFKYIPSQCDNLRIYHPYGSHVECGEHYDDISFGYVKSVSEYGSSSTSSETGGFKYGSCGEYITDINVYDSTTANDNIASYAYKGDLTNNLTRDNIEELLSEDYNYLEATEHCDLQGFDDGIIVVEKGQILIKDGDKYIVKDYSDAGLTDFNYYYVGVLGGEQTMHNFTEALANCINEMPQRMFTAYAYENQVILVCDENGNLNDSLSVELTCERKTTAEITGDVRLLGSNRYYAVGGTVTSNIMLIDNIYEDSLSYNNVVRVNDGYSYISSITRYAADFECNLDKEGIKNAFETYNNYVAVIPQKDKFAKLSENKCFISTEYIVHYGLFSFYKVKDFDFDYISTRYSKSAYWDEYKYNIPSGVKLLKKGIIYKKNGNCEIDSYDTKISYSYGSNDTMFYIGDYDDGNCYSYYIKSGDGYVTPYLYLTGYNDKVSSITFDGDKLSETVDIEGNIIYCIDDDEPNSVRTTSLENGVDCEYDFYKENTYSQFETVSKLVPYICKWGYSDGNDLFGNPYRLNDCDAFGRNNNSPSDSMTVDSNAFTNEWYYIVSNQDNSIDNYCYINKPFDINKISFDDYFRIDTGGVTRYLYSTVKYNESIGQCETFFRGEKIVFKEYDSIGNLIESNTKYDGYKFSALLVPKKIDDYDEGYPAKPVEYIFDKNDEQKFLLFYINLYLDDNKVNKDTYRINPSTDIMAKFNFVSLLSKLLKNDNDEYFDFGPQGNFILCDFDGEINMESGAHFNVEDGDILVCDEYANDKLFEYSYSGSGSETPEIVDVNESDEIRISYRLIKKYTDLNEIYPFYRTILSNDPEFIIDADYRISFDEKGISSLTYSDIYNFISKKYTNTSESYANISIPQHIRFNSISSKIGKDGSVKNYDSSFFRMINSYSGYSPLIIRTSFDDESDYQWTALLNSYKNSPIPKAVMKYCDTDYIYTTYTMSDKMNLNKFYYDKESNLLKEYNVSKQEQLYQLCGGEGYFRDNIFKSITFGTISGYVMNNMKYIENHAGVSMEFQNPSSIKKTNYISVVPDDSTGDLLNYTYSVSSSIKSDSVRSGNINLFRYSGGYDPIFNDVIYFSNDYEYGYNTKFNTGLSSFGILKNFCHLKISDQNLFETVLTPKSSLTGNTTIGTADMNVLHTSWDLDFHKYYSNATHYEDKPGTLRIPEDDTFVNNIINLPGEVRLTKFKVEQVPDAYAVNDMSDYELIYSIKNNEVSIRVNFKQVMINKLRELGIDSAFDQIKMNDGYMEYLGCNFSKYIEKYLTQNIIDLYTVDSSNVFYKTRESSTSSKFGISQDDFDMLKSGNFSIDKNVKINNCDSYVADFTYYIKNNFNPVINFVLILKLI